MADRTILVVNPNASVVMTDAIAASLPSDVRTGSQLRFMTNAAGPLAIESDADVIAAARQVFAIAAQEPNHAIVIACFSDPGVVSVRATGRPLVFGIAESAYRAAVAAHGGFGVISIVGASIARHARHVESLRLTAHLHGDRSLDLGVAGASDESGLARIIAIGRLLRDVDKAPAIILGCAGMGRHRSRVEAELGIPVLDPVLEGVRAARTALG